MSFISAAGAQSQIRRDAEIDRSVQLSCGEHTVSILRLFTCMCNVLCPCGMSCA
jgi:hypothetical protein